MQKRLFTQLALGRGDLERFSPRQIADRIVQAAFTAGLTGLLFWPSGDADVDCQARAAARKAGLELYLWLPALADAAIEPEETELTVNAWDEPGNGGSGRWPGLGRGDETFLFACPESPRHIESALERCREELAEYDGVFLDRIRYPSPANGLETLLTCFCPRCRERYPQSDTWRSRIRQFRRQLHSATDAEAERWDSVTDLLTEHGLGDFHAARARSVSALASTISRAAADMGKKVGLDLFTPSLARLVGQDYHALGAMADWIKPMSYCRARGPAGLPLELACLARGISAWAGNLREAVVMAFLRRSFGLPGLPDSAAELERTGMDESAAGLEYARAEREAACPVYPGFECVKHPDFDFSMSREGVERYLTAFADAPGMVMAWNILYIPDDYLRLAAERAR